MRGGGDRRAGRFLHAVFHAEKQVVEELFRLAPPLFGEKILHVGGESVHEGETEIPGEFPDKPVGGHVVEMLGGGDLSGVLAVKIHAALLHRLHEPHELGGDEEGVDRITEDQAVRRRRLTGEFGGVVERKGWPSPRVDHGEPVLGMELFKVQGRLEGDGILSLRGTVQNQKIHAVVPFRRHVCPAPLYHKSSVLSRIGEKTVAKPLRSVLY